MSGLFKEGIKLLASVMGKIFDALAPVLVEILESILKLVYNFVMDVLEEWFYRLNRSLLRMIEYLEKLARFFLGMDQISINGKKISFLDHVFSFPQINKIFFGSMVIAFLLLLLITIFQMVPTINEDEDQQPLSTVIRRSMSSVFRMFEVWVACAILLHGSIAMIGGVCTLSTGGGSLPDSVFASVMVGFAKNPAQRDSLMKEYSNPSNTIRSYKDISQAKKDFENPKLAWFVIYFAEIQCILSMLGMVYAAAKRGLSVVVIYIFGPLVTALSIENENVFRRYQRQLFAQFFSFLSATLSLSVFYIIVGFVGRLSFSFSETKTVEGIIRCTIISLFVMSIDEVSDMLVTLLSGVGFNDFQSSKQSATRQAFAAYAMTRGMTMGAADKIARKAAESSNSGDASGRAHSGGVSSKLVGLLGGGLTEAIGGIDNMVNAAAAANGVAAGGAGVGESALRSIADRVKSTAGGIFGSGKATPSNLEVDRDNKGPMLASNENAASMLGQEQPTGKQTNQKEKPEKNVDKPADGRKMSESFQQRLTGSNKINQSELEDDGRAIDSPTTADTSEGQEDNTLANILITIVKPFARGYGAVSSVISGVGNIVKKAKRGISGTLGGAAQAVGHFFEPVVTPIISTFSDAKEFLDENVAQPIGKATDVVKRGVRNAASVVTRPFRAAGGYVKRAIEITGKFLDKMKKH